MNKFMPLLIVGELKVSGMLCREAPDIAHFNIALCFDCEYTMQDEHNQQIATEGAGGGLPHGTTHVACLPSSLQSQEVYATSVVRLPGIENVYEN